MDRVWTREEHDDRNRQRQKQNDKETKAKTTKATTWKRKGLEGLCERAGWLNANSICEVIGCHRAANWTECEINYLTTNSNKRDHSFSLFTCQWSIVGPCIMKTLYVVLERAPWTEFDFFADQKIVLLNNPLCRRLAHLKSPLSFAKTTFFKSPLLVQYPTSHSSSQWVNMEAVVPPNLLVHTPILNS